MHHWMFGSSLRQCQYNYFKCSHILL